MARAPWHNSAAATRSQLEEGAATQLSISSAPRSKARGGLGRMLPDSQQACCPCFLKHWTLNPHMPRQHSCMATSAISSCSRQFPSLLELLWSRFVRGQGASAEVAVVLQRVTMSTPPGRSSSLFLRHGVCSHEPASPWQPGTLGQAQAQLSARVGFPGEPQSPHTHRSSADGSSACATPPSGRRCRGALRHRPPAGPGTSAPRAGLSRQARGEPSLVATPSKPCRCLLAPHGARGTVTKRLKISPLPRDFPLPSLTFGVPGVHWVPAGQAAGLGAE